jgi:hypothetical protein
MNGYYALACVFSWLAFLSFVWWLAEVNADEARKRRERGE